jgi:Rrf2 family protein
MIFSQSSQYAIKSCIYLARNNKVIGVTEIAEFINSPISFTSKILQRLAKNEIISSTKGRNGGFYLNEVQLQTITIKDICTVFEQREFLHGCILGKLNCSEINPCPVHHIALVVNEKLRKILSFKIIELKDIGSIKL